MIPENSTDSVATPLTAEPPAPEQLATELVGPPSEAPPEAGHQRGTIAEWTITILLLLFLTTTLVQAFVIPTGSMEDTLLIGDHLLVDKLAYAPGGTGQQIPAALHAR